jgi:hypothetical protein
VLDVVLYGFGALGLRVYHCIKCSVYRYYWSYEILLDSFVQICGAYETYSSVADCCNEILPFQVRYHSNRPIMIIDLFVSCRCNEKREVFAVVI